MPDEFHGPDTGRTVRLRAVRPEDLDLFFVHQQDEDARAMAAFVGRDAHDRAAFDRHWSRILADPDVTIRTIEVEVTSDADVVVGHVAVYPRDGQREVTYWVARDHWGQGYASAALRALAGEIAERPLFGRAAFDNGGSIRVLSKCGFHYCGAERAYAEVRGVEIDEVLYRLD